VGGLAHFFEEEGIATTQISLIREHTVTMRPPRALWVPFELGRPLGSPNDPEFQLMVLRHTLALLEAAHGPVLEDFPEDAPVSGAQPLQVACPISLAPPSGALSATEQLLAEFEQEMAQMLAWYDLAIEKRGRTTAVTGRSPQEAAAMVAGFVRDSKKRGNLAGRLNFDVALRLAIEDVKTFYMEAVTAQPGNPTDSTSLADWFWGTTVAAGVIAEVRRICLSIEEPEFQLLGQLLLVPRIQLHRFEA